MAVSIHLDQYVEIGIGTEQFAFRIEDIHEIIKIQPITAVPGSNPHMLGVINLRGTVAPVVSLRRRFGLPDIEHTKTSRIVIVHHHETAVGLLVDEVHQVTTFDDIQPPPERIGGLDSRYIAGIGKSGDDLVSILKLDQVLA